MPSNFTLQDSCNSVSPIIRGEVLLGSLGIALQPALTMANILKSKILSPPFAWPWNRTVKQFYLTGGTQDYKQSIATFGWLELAEAGLGALITNTAQAFGFASYTAINSFKAGQLVNVQGSTNGSGIFNVNGLPVSATGLASVSFQLVFPAGTTASAADAGTAFVVGSNFELQVQQVLGRDVGAGQRPVSICILADDDAGNITFRFHSTPDQAYLATLTYQNQVVPFAAGTDTWTPMPDARMQHVYMSGFKALCFQKARPELFLSEWSNFLSSLVGMSQGLTETQKEIYLRDELAKARAGADISLGPAKGMR